MKLQTLFDQKKVVFSLEIFPPKKTASIQTIYDTLDALSDISPDFISVTYGAGGSTSKKTVEVASYIQERHHLPALAHLTCCDSTKEDIRQRLAEMKERGIENILALRGDKPKEYVPGPYTYAIDLIRDIKSQGDFCIGGACYPDGHVECEHKEDDIAF